MLLKNRAVTLLAVATLALGIGANTAVFSVVDAVLLRPLHFPHSDRICFVWKTNATRGTDSLPASEPEFLDWRERSRSFSELSAWQSWFFTITGAGTPEQLWGVRVSANFFDMLEVTPERGRTFLASEDEPGHDAEAVLSHALWVRRYGSDPNLINRTIQVDGKPVTVIGILPARYNRLFADTQYDIFMPLPAVRDESERDFGDTLVVYGRLKDGVSVAAAQSDMQSVFDDLRREYPDSDLGDGMRVAPVLEDLVQPSRPALYMLLGSALLVLLIACANVACLLLARGSARSKEMALRRALGASPWRMMRQLLVESVLLAAIGGIAGIWLGYLALQALRGMGTLPDIPRLSLAGLDPIVVGFALALALATGILSGLAPAASALRGNLSETLKEGGRSGGAGRHRRRFQDIVVVFEVAMSLVLLVGAGLLLRSFVDLLDTSPGFRHDHVLTMRVWLPQNKYSEPERIADFYQRALEQVSATPGVLSAGAVSSLPLAGWAAYIEFTIDGQPTAPNAMPWAGDLVVSTGYFRTMGITLEQGRFFTDADNTSGAGVVILSRTASQFYFEGRNPLGKRIALTVDKSAATPGEPHLRSGWLTIVGVVGDIREWELGDPKLPALYLPASQNPSPLMNLTIRTRRDPLQVASSAVAALQRVDPDQPVRDIRSMDQYLDDAVGIRRFNLTLLASFAALAVLLAAIGLYGLMAYSVTQRIQEIGVRMALGAEPRDIQRMVLNEGLRLGLWGLLAGCLAAAGLVRLLAGELFGVAVWDPITYIGVAIILLAVAGLASYLPARRATRVNPLRALRYE
ncbi:MAG: ABC transporter permease [Candidatus Acidiferrales bacterium]